MVIYAAAEAVTKGSPHQARATLCTAQIQGLSSEPEVNLWAVTTVERRGNNGLGYAYHKQPALLMSLYQELSLHSY